VGGAQLARKLDRYRIEIVGLREDPQHRVHRTTEMRCNHKPSLGGRRMDWNPDKPDGLGRDHGPPKENVIPMIVCVWLHRYSRGIKSVRHVGLGLVSLSVVSFVTLESLCNS